MSARDRDRLKVLHEVGKGHLTQKQGGEQLGVTERWVRKLLARMRKEGDRGILHRLRAGVESEDRGEDAAEGGEVGGEQVRGFWTDAGERVPGEAGGDPGQ